MNTILSLLALISTLTSNQIYTETGKLTYYNPGVMERVYQNRLLWNQVEPCADCVGMIAVKDCEQLGSIAFLYFIRGSYVVATGPYLIVDCSNRAHLKDHIQSNLVAEVDYQTAKKFNMSAPLYDVTIHVVSD